MTWGSAVGCKVQLALLPQARACGGGARVLGSLAELIRVGAAGHIMT